MLIYADQSWVFSSGSVHQGEFHLWLDCRHCLLAPGAVPQCMHHGTCCLCKLTTAVSGSQNLLLPVDSCVSTWLGPDQHCRIQAFSASIGARQVISLKDLGQLEQSGYAEIELTLQSVQMHTALPVLALSSLQIPISSSSACSLGSW